MLFLQNSKDCAPQCNGEYLEYQQPLGKHSFAAPVKLRSGPSPGLEVARSVPVERQCGIKGGR